MKWCPSDDMQISLNFDYRTPAPASKLEMGHGCPSTSLGSTEIVYSGLVHTYICCYNFTFEQDKEFVCFIYNPQYYQHDDSINLFKKKHCLNITIVNYPVGTFTSKWKQGSYMTS